jgi:hypothetical protein
MYSMKQLSLSTLGPAALLMALSACGALEPTTHEAQGSAALMASLAPHQVDQDFATASEGVGTAVRLGSAGRFAMQSRSGITDAYASAIAGDFGTSPVTGAALLLTCRDVTGNSYLVDAAGPLPCALNDATSLTTAIGDKEVADLEGVVLAKTLIAVNTGASVKGRLLAQTAVTLQMNAVTQPAP